MIVPDTHRIGAVVAHAWEKGYFKIVDITVDGFHVRQVMTSNFKRRSSSVKIYNDHLFLTPVSKEELLAKLNKQIEIINQSYA